MDQFEHLSGPHAGLWDLLLGLLSDLPGILLEHLLWAKAWGQLSGQLWDPLLEHLLLGPFWYQSLRDQSVARLFDLFWSLLFPWDLVLLEAR